MIDMGSYYLYGLCVLFWTLHVIYFTPLMDICMLFVYSVDGCIYICVDRLVSSSTDLALQYGYGPLHVIYLTLRLTLIQNLLLFI